MTGQEIALVSIFAAVLFIPALVFICLELSKKSLDPKVIKTATSKIKATSKLDPNLSLIESHKIMTNTLKTMFKNKSLTSAKMLNKVSRAFKNEKEFWHFHRMRNKAAHENDFKVTKTDAAKARKIFQEALATIKD